MRTDPPIGDELTRMLATMKTNVLRRADETRDQPAPARQTRMRIIGITIALVSLLIVGSAGAALATGIIPSPFPQPVPVATSTPSSTPTPSTTPTTAPTSTPPVDEATIRAEARAEAAQACTTIAAALDENGNSTDEPVWHAALLDAHNLVQQAADSDAAWAEMSTHIATLIETPSAEPDGTPEQKNNYFYAYLPVATDCSALDVPLPTD